MYTTKEQLIEALQALPDGAQVRMAVPAGDYWKTLKTPPVVGFRESVVQPNGYHDCECEVKDPDEAIEVGELGSGEMEYDDKPATLVYLMVGA